MSREEINYRKEVFLHPWNLWFLIGALAGTLGLSSTPIGGGSLFATLFIFTFALELLVLGTVPTNARFRKMVQRKRARELAKPPTPVEIYRQLSRSSQRRYVRLRDLQKKIESNYQKFSFASQPILEGHIAKLNGLLASCLSLLHERQRQVNIRQNLQETDLLSALATLRKEVENDAERIRNIKMRRIKVLMQRLDRYRKSHEQLEVIDAQVATIEDVVMYIHEKSMTMRDPEEITYQLDILLDEVGNTEESVLSTEAMFGSSTNLDELDQEWLDAPAQRARA
ncbi:MAG: hypothetical protein OXU68_11845 [Bacteroidota bacterium]|nr:hypothetical protein [Bacteroidota bacterium]MDE2957683.1 hypothetical protein [Bacteroidota bacterium]